MGIDDLTYLICRICATVNRVALGFFSACLAEQIDFSRRDPILRGLNEFLPRLMPTRERSTVLGYCCKASVVELLFCCKATVELLYCCKATVVELLFCGLEILLL